MAVTSFAAWRRLPWTDECNSSCAAFNLAHLINGQSPGLIVLDQFSDEAWEGMATSQPARYSAVKARLTRYRKVYDRDGYRVYLPLGS